MHDAELLAIQSGLIWQSLLPGPAEIAQIARNTAGANV
jgi:hypothetical protein